MRAPFTFRTFRAFRRITRAAAASFALTALFAVDARTADANPPDTFGFGSRGAAMGGAVSADVSDFSANYYNPAGLARAHGFEMSIGYFRADHTLRTNGNDNRVDPVKGLVGGLVAPGKILGIPFAFGLGIHLPDDRISRVRALPQEQPRWELYDNRNQRLYLATNIAISPFPWLQIGGGLSFMSSTEGSLDISGNANITAVEKSSLRHEVSADLTAVRYPQLGARVALGKRVALAVVYRGEFQLALDLKAKLHGEIQQGLTTALYELTTDSVNAFLPQQVVLGGSWLVTDDLRFGFDATWVNWSAYIAPVASIDVNLNIPLPPGGLGNLTLPTTPAPTHIVPIVMHDRVVPHVGVEWRAIARPKWEAFVRGGYEYAKSPIAAQTGITNYIDRDRHSISAGLGGKLLAPIRELPGDVRLDVHAQLSELVTATTFKADPSNTIGDYTAGGHIWNVGATLTVGF